MQDLSVTGASESLNMSIAKDKISCITLYKVNDYDNLAKYKHKKFKKRKRCHSTPFQNF